MRVLLSIAGFDPSNGAGVTADLQVFAAHGHFGMSAITALTVQSTLGVAATAPVSGTTLRHTLEHLAADVDFAGVKIGMLGSRDAVVVVAEVLQSLRAGGAQFPVVFDPVLRSSSGAELLPADGVEAMRAGLLGQVTWLTPNWAELAALTGLATPDSAAARRGLRECSKRFPGLHIVATGGDAEGDAVDMWLSPEGDIEEFRAARIDTRSTHGTGCAFSSALLSRLVYGSSPRDAVLGAKEYVMGALRHAPEIGQGRGPLDLLWPLRP